MYVFSPTLRKKIKRKIASWIGAWGNRFLALKIVSSGVLWRNPSSKVIFGLLVRKKEANYALPDDLAILVEVQSGLFKFCPRYQIPRGLSLSIFIFLHTTVLTCVLPMQWLCSSLGTAHTTEEEIKFTPQRAHGNVCLHITSSPPASERKEKLRQLSATIRALSVSDVFGRSHSFFIFRVGRNYNNESLLQILAEKSAIKFSSKALR